MKAYKITKRKGRRFSTYVEVKTYLPKPQIPRIFIAKVHKLDLIHIEQPNIDTTSNQ
jgi:hypothetical protein